MVLSYHIAMAEKQSKKPLLPKGARRRRKPVGTSTGLAAVELQAAAPPGAVAELHQLIEADEGKVLSVYRDPYGGQWLLQAALPINLVEPTPMSESWKGSSGKSVFRSDHRQRIANPTM